MNGDDPAGTGSGTGPRSVLRVLDILAALSLRPEGATLTQLVDILCLPKTSVFSLLKELEAGDYLRRSDSVYRLGPASLKLGTAMTYLSPFPRCARPALETLASRTGETVMLGVLSEDGHEVSYVDILESDAPLRFTVRIGNRRPLYAAAAGKALLAFLPEAARRDYLASTRIIRFTDETSTRAALARMLPTIRRTGVVLDANGIVDGAAAIASPCFGNDDRVACAVSVAGPTGRVVAQRAQIQQLVLSAAEEISRILGFGGAFPPGISASDRPHRAELR